MNSPSAQVSHDQTLQALEPPRYRRGLIAFVSIALFGTALFAAVVAPPSADVSAQSSGNPITPLSSSGCTDGTFVDISANPRVAGNNNDLAEDCQALVAIQNSWATAANADLANNHPLRRWGTGGSVRVNSWTGITVSGGRVTSLKLDRRSLEGSIPAAIGRLNGLTDLQLWENQLSGSLPAEISGLTNLVDMYISDNQLSGSLPAEISSLTSLRVFSIYENRFSGSIPTQICTMTSLRRIDFGTNMFSGSLPACLGDLTELTLLNFFENQLTGSIPVELGSLTKLTTLYLDSNKLTGSIPAQVASLATSGTGVLNRFDFCANRLSGAVPAALQSGVTLTDYPTARGFDPIQCQNGPLPALASAGCTDGTFVDLSTNPRVQGSDNDLAEDCQALVAIRNSLATATGNEYVIWNDNLRQWGVGSNEKISTWPGVTVATSRVTQLKLNGKNLAGSMTADYGKLTGLTALWLDGNQLASSIPTQIGSLTSLTELRLNNNRLTGSIPTEISSLTSLTELLLNDNLLSGSIPEQLGTLATSGALATLGICNNYLSGAVPTALQSGVTLTDYPTTEGYATVACQIPSNIVFTPPATAITLSALTAIVINAAPYATDGNYAITCQNTPNTDPKISTITRNGCNFTVSASDIAGSTGLTVTYTSAGGSTRTATIPLTVTPAPIAFDPVNPPQNPNQPTSEQPTTPPTDQTPEDAPDPDSTATPDPDSQDAPDRSGTAITLEPDQPGPRWNTLTVGTGGTTASRIRQAFSLGTAQSIYTWNADTQTWTRATNASQAIPPGTAVSFRTQEMVSSTDIAASDLDGATTQTRLNPGWNIITPPEGITRTNGRDFLISPDLYDCRNRQGVIAVASYSTRSRQWSLWMPCHPETQRSLTTGENAPYRPLTSIAPADTTYIYTRTSQPINIAWNPETQTYQTPPANLFG